MAVPEIRGVFQRHGVPSDDLRDIRRVYSSDCLRDGCICGVQRLQRVFLMSGGEIIATEVFSPVTSSRNSYLKLSAMSTKDFIIEVLFDTH